MFAFTGVAAVVYGISQMFAPAAWIVGGLAMTAFGLTRDVGDQ